LTKALYLNKVSVQMKIDSSVRNLTTAFLTLQNEQEMTAFLRDLLTLDEIKDFSRRWEVVQMLDKKISYKKIEEQAKMSSTTIARISSFLKGKHKGYKLVLNRLSSQHHHSGPVSPVCFDS
jgi:TrpR-related protein YerC/YecD